MLEPEPSAQSSLQKLNVGNSSQKKKHEKLDIKLF